MYRIQLLSNSRQRKVVHYNRLKPYEGGNYNQEDHSLIWEMQNTQQQNNEEDLHNISDTIQQNIQESEAPMEQGNDQTENSGEGQNNNLSEQMQQPQLRQSTRARRPPERYGSVISFPDSDHFPD